MVDGDIRAEKVGKRTVLSTSFIGGPRDMRRRYMDAMALVRKFGKPDIFLTMTCNPNWDCDTRFAKRRSGGYSFCSFSSFG